MTAPTKTAAAQNKNAPPPQPYPFPVGVYESIIQDYDQQVINALAVSAWVAPVQAPIWNVSPTGWLRTLWLDFTLTIAGNAATPVFTADDVFALVNKVTVYDLGNIVVMQLTGYEWMLTNKFGGYYTLGDPRNDITYSKTTGSGASAGSCHFALALPFETVARDALGTVQNESKPGWKVELYIAAASAVYSTQPTATGTASVHVKGYAESYTEPAAAASNGRPFAQTPPLPGTIANWRSENLPLPAGNAKYDLTNGIGYPIRNVIYYGRDASDQTRATADNNWPDPAQLTLGSVVLFNRSKSLWQTRLGRDFDLFSVTADSASGRENGVYPVYFTRDFGLQPGDEMRFKYLDTQVNSQLRFSGSFGGAMTFFALVNWLAVPSKNRYSLIAGR